jgi:hypothetical protein
MSRTRFEGAEPILSVHGTSGARGRPAASSRSGQAGRRWVSCYDVLLYARPDHAQPDSRLHPTAAEDQTRACVAGEP